MRKHQWRLMETGINSLSKTDVYQCKRCHSLTEDIEEPSGSFYLWPSKEDDLTIEVKIYNNVYFITDGPLYWILVRNKRPDMYPQFSFMVPYRPEHQYEFYFRKTTQI